MGEQPRWERHELSAGDRVSVLVRVAKLLDPLNSCCGCRISLENGSARGFEARGPTAAGLVGWRASCPFLGVPSLSGGVCTKLEHHRTFVGPLVGWWVFVPVGCMFELVSGCWSRGPPCAKGGRDSSPRLAGCWLGSYGSLCKLVLGLGVGS